MTDGQKVFVRLFLRWFQSQFPQPLPTDYLFALNFLVALLWQKKTGQVPVWLLAGPWPVQTPALQACLPAETAGLPGLVYEKLLAAGWRKDRGVFYTPGFLAAIMWQQSQGPGRLFDPACGSGQLLVPAAVDLLQANRSLPPEAALDMLAGQIFGMDLDPLAVHLARLEILWLVFAGSGRLPEPCHYQRLEKNICCADFLAIENPPAGWPRSFERLLLNPPYVSLYSRHSRQSAARAEHWPDRRGKKGRRNLSMPFIEKAILWLAPLGHYSLLADLNLRENPYADLRRWLFEQTEICSVTEGLQAFAGVNSGQLLVAGRKKSRPAGQSGPGQVWFLGPNLEPAGQVAEELLRQKNSLHLLQQNSLLEKLAGFSRLQEHVQVSCGVNIGGAEHLFVHTEARGPDFLPFLATGQLQFPYQQLSASSRWINFSETLAREVNRQNREKGSRNVVALGQRSRFLQNRVLLRQSAARLIASLVTDTLVCPYSYLVISNRSSYSCLYILALLNSDLYSYYAIESGLVCRGAGKQPQIRVRGLRSLPFLAPNLQNPGQSELYQEIVRLAGLLLLPAAGEGQRQIWREQLEQKIHDLHGLDASEKNLLADFRQKNVSLLRLGSPG